MNSIETQFTQIRRAIRMMLARALGRGSSSSGGLQTLQLELLAGEVRDNVDHLEGYGMTANPPSGFEALVASLNGRREAAVAIAALHRGFRVRNLAAGEVALYTDEGDTIYFKRGRSIEITAGTKVKVTAPEVEVVASSKVTITSPLTSISQNVTIGGTLAVTGQITGQGGVAISGGTGAQVTGNIAVTSGNVTADGIGLKTHVHGGVQPGSGTTGAPQ